MIIYISNSYYPSVEANLVHVLNQVHALKKINHNVKLVLVSSLCKEEIVKSIFINYGLNFEFNNFLIYNSKSAKFKELKSLILGLFFICFNFKSVNFIISRNLFFSFFYFGSNLISEFHTIYNSIIRSTFQNIIIKRKYQKNIFISKRLFYYLSLKDNFSNHLILHDAATKQEDCLLNSKITREYVSSFFLKDQYLCLYSGSLHEGRGIDVIIYLANENPDINFLIIGHLNPENSFLNSDNIYFLGYVPYIDIRSYLMISDVLLMPYQNKVSINVKGQDTSKWMSPLKLFEYMSVMKPIISSNLPVLREILKSNNNCKLVKFNSHSDWNSAINFIKNNPDYSRELGKNAYIDFNSNYTWDIRALRIFNFFYEI